MKFLKMPYEFVRMLVCVAIGFVNYARGNGFSACNDE